MSGETDLHKLICSMRPAISDSEYVFVSIDNSSTICVSELAPLGTFHEQEGLTVIVLKTTADLSGLNYEGIFQCITLNVHSSLEAVGLTAAVSSALASEGISANVVAAYYHDHIFIPVAKAEQALSCLLSLVDKQH